jgi:hypothetical protein
MFAVDVRCSREIKEAGGSANSPVRWREWEGRCHQLFSSSVLHRPVRSCS